MPSFDGTGPLGQGPMTGRGQGFCVLTNSKENHGQLEGLAGLHGVPINQEIKNSENTGKEVINMPLGDGTGPIGWGSRAGRGIDRRAGRGRMGGPFAAGPGGNCVCPNCGATVAHVAGQPCNAKSCPKCGTNMTRG